MTIAIVATVLAVIAATAEGGGAGRTSVGQGANSIEQFWLEKPLEFWLDISLH